MNLQKIIALGLAVMMLLPMGLPVGAITVSGAEKGAAQGPVALDAQVWDFAEDSQIADFSLYQSADSSFSVQNGMLVPSGASGEMKAIVDSDIQDIQYVSVDIIPGPSGLINGGLYIGASNAGNTADQIDAVAFLVESWFSGWSDAPNRIDLVTGEFPVWKEHKRLISETGNGNALFSKGVKEPLNLRVDFGADMLTVTLSLVSNAGKYVQTVFECDPADMVGAVGVRANNSDVCFDNFKIGYERKVPQKLQQGLDFTEIGNKAQMNNAAGMIPQTVEAWVKVNPDTKAERTAIIGAFHGPYTADAQKGDWALFTDGNGRLWWYEKNDSGQYSSAKGTTIKTGEWVHVAITRADGVITYYINGSEVANSTGNIVLDTASTKAPTLGYCEYGGENVNYLDGAIGDVRLWSTTRTAAQVREDMFTEAAGTEEGLMSHWALDEQAGTVFWDSAASGNHGSIAGNAGLNWTEGSSLNEGLEFSEVGAKVTLTQTTGTIPQTVEAWVRVDQDTAASRTGIISAFTGPYTADAQKGDWALFTDGGGKLWWYEKNAKGQYSSAKGTTIKTGEWTHVAITRDEGVIKYYINGIEAASVESEKIVLGETSSKVPTLGYCEYGGENYNYLDGALGDVRLWSTTRTPEEIRSTMYKELEGTEEGLLSCWNLNEQNGVQVADCTNTANHGQLNAAWLKNNQGLEFAGNCGAIAAASKATGTIPQTVEAWVKIDKNTAASRTGIVSTFTGPYTADAKKGDWALFTDGNGRLWWYEKNAKGQYSSAKGTSIKTGDWVHVAITRDDGSIKYYINGNEVATNTGNIVLGEASSRIPTLGYCEYGGENVNYLDGALRDVRLWSTTRTAEEIKANMNVTLTGTEAGLMSYWKLNEQSGTAFKDSASAGNDGTVALGGVTWLPGIQAEQTVTPEQNYDNEGFNFSQNSVWVTAKELDVSPNHTVEAWVKIPKAVKSSNMILQNDILARFEFSVTAGGNPRLYWLNEDDTKTEVIASGAKVNTGKWSHIAFVSNASAKTVTCYVNGVVVHVAENVVMNDIVTKKLYVGNPFLGIIGDLRIWDKALTGQEVRSSMNSVYTQAMDGLVLNVPMDETDPTILRDLSGNENDIEIYQRRLDWKTDTTEPKDYSIVVIPDQQVLSSRYPEYLTQIYQWIAENAEQENIKFAIGLGDITDYNTEEEWNLSLEALERIDGIVPYSMIPGNHEYVIPGGYKYDGYGYRNTTQMNKYFGHIYDNQSEFGGSYDEGVENTWHEFEAFGNQYLVFGFEYAPRDSVLAWASEIIEAHPYHQVIVTTHGYMQSDGVRMTTPTYGYLYEEGKEDPNSAQEMWDEFISQHENIIMVLCGHVLNDNVVTRVDEGVNGNPVLQMMINGQDIDGKYRGVGFLAMMRFSADGQNMELTYFSPYHGENGEDEYLNDNILNFTIPAMKKTPVAQVGKNYYATVAEAVANANGQIVTVLADTDEAISVNVDVTIDLAGHTLGHVTVAEGATLYGMDSATDAYDCTDGYGKIGSITGSYALHHKTVVDDNPQRYLAVVEEDGISFHRFYIGIQSVSLKPGAVGFGYKAIFGGDEKVKAALAQQNAFGFALWVTEDNVISRGMDAADFATGKNGTPLTLCLKNFDVVNHGQTDVYARVYITLADGTRIDSAEYACSMQKMLEQVNTDIVQYSDAQIRAVQTMLAPYADTVSSWNIADIRNWKTQETA